MVVAEIQQSSDITYRVYDWGREHDPLTAREMHLDMAIDCINYSRYKESVKNISGSGKEGGEHYWLTVNILKYPCWSHQKRLFRIAVTSILL